MQSHIASLTVLSLPDGVAKMIDWRRTDSAPTSLATCNAFSQCSDSALRQMPKAPTLSPGSRDPKHLSYSLYTCLLQRKLSNSHDLHHSV